MTKTILPLALLALAGCPMAGSYHTAHTLPKGISRTGVIFSASTLEIVTDINQNGVAENTDIPLPPTLVPELTYHVGMSDDLEVGGRVSLASLSMEGDFKYRFFQNNGLHIAVAPALRYSAALFVKGLTVNVPLILTKDLSDNLSVTFAGFARSTDYDTIFDSIEGFDQLNGTLTATGAAAGLTLRGSVLEISPSVEVLEYVAAIGKETFEPFRMLNIALHLAWIGGQEKQQLDRIEKKLDRIDQKLDNNNGGYSPAPSAK